MPHLLLDCAEYCCATMLQALSI